MTAPDRPIPERTLTGNQLASLQNWNNEAEAAARNQDIRNKGEAARGNFFSNILAGFVGGIGQLIINIVGAITGGSHTDIPGLAGWMGGLKGQVDDHGELINVHGQQIAELEEFAGTGTTTPIWASTGGHDLVTFPDTLMQPVPDSVTGSTNLGGHSHGISSPGSSSSTQSEFLGSHNHSIGFKPPSFNAAKSTIDMAFLRGGRDADTKLEVLRIITGGDTALFDIDAWYVGIYVYDAPNSRMTKVWDSGNIKNVLTSQRRRYHLGTGMTQAATNDQLLAVASLQIAPGALQKPRGIGCIFQTGIVEQAGTIPGARNAFVNGQSSLPLQIPMSSINWDNTKIMWAAVGESAT